MVNIESRRCDNAEWFLAVPRMAYDRPVILFACNIFCAFDIPAFFCCISLSISTTRTYTLQPSSFATRRHNLISDFPSIFKYPYKYYEETVFFFVVVMSAFSSSSLWSIAVCVIQKPLTTSEWEGKNEKSRSVERNSKHSCFFFFFRMHRDIFFSYCFSCLGAHAHTQFCFFFFAMHIWGAAIHRRPADAKI